MRSATSAIFSQEILSGRLLWVLQNKEYVLAAKFFTKRALNVEVVGHTFKPLWRAKKDFKAGPAQWYKPLMRLLKAPSKKRVPKF